jgi:hypothetical protein
MSEEEREIDAKTVQTPKEGEKMRKWLIPIGIQSERDNQSQGNLNGKINTILMVSHNLVVANQTPTRGSDENENGE